MAILSTVSVAVIHEFDALARDHGVDLVDIGVTGLPAAVAEGRLVCMAGGSAPVMEAATEVLDEFAASVHHLGPVGSGMAAKIALNTITYGTWRTVHEACSLAEGVGVDLPAFLTAVEEGDPSGQLRFLLIGSRGTTKRPTELDAATAEGARRMDVIMRKDLQAAQGLAGDLGLSVPLIDVAEQQVSSTLGLEEDAMVDQEDLDRGADMMQQVYGFRPDGWDRHAAVRAHHRGALRRHLVAAGICRSATAGSWCLGIAASLGRADLIEVQLLGALRNGEIEVAQVDEIVLHLAFYVGWPQTSPNPTGSLRRPGELRGRAVKSRTEKRREASVL